MGVVLKEAHFPGRAPIDAYGKGGFRFAAMSHVGSLLCVPSGIYGWGPAFPGEIDAAALQRVLAEREDIDVVLIGMGPMPLPLGDEAAAALRKGHLRFDTMTTGAAVRTFNVMVAEERRVAAALLAV